MAKAIHNPKHTVLLRIRMERDVERTLPGGARDVLRAGETYTIDEETGIPLTEPTKGVEPVMKDGVQVTENGAPVFQEVMVPAAATVLEHKELVPTTPIPKKKAAPAAPKPVIRPLATTPAVAAAPDPK
jgi:hypothetical protein